MTVALLHVAVNSRASGGVAAIDSKANVACNVCASPALLVEGASFPTALETPDKVHQVEILVGHHVEKYISLFRKVENLWHSREMVHNHNVSASTPQRMLQCQTAGQPDCWTAKWRGHSSQLHWVLQHLEHQTPHDHSWKKSGACEVERSVIFVPTRVPLVSLEGLYV